MIVNRCYSGSLLDVDRYWRVVVIIGVLPTLLGISARFSCVRAGDILGLSSTVPKQALEDLKYVYGLHDASSGRNDSNIDQAQTQTVDVTNRNRQFW
ncbi:hypothetical protein MRB53_041680 [Persea americana]|nr:hypothetical protein MRB53_041680 [Persea americana]